jgi:hypothetical protein
MGGRAYEEKEKEKEKEKIGKLQPDILNCFCVLYFNKVTCYHLFITQ